LDGIYLGDTKVNGMVGLVVYYLKWSWSGISIVMLYLQLKVGALFICLSFRSPLYVC